MSKFMPHSIHGNFDPEGTIGHTHLLKISLMEVSNKISQLDPNSLSSYTAINETTAYFKFLTSQINGIDDTFTVNPNSKYHDYIIKYIMITTFIMMSGVSSDINCEVSYLRIGQDEFSPFRNSNSYYGGSHFDDILNSWAEYLDPNLIAFDSTHAMPIRMLCIVKLNGIPVAYYTSQRERVIFYPFNTITSDENTVESLKGIHVNSGNEWEFDYNRFKGEVLSRLTDNQKATLAAALQMYANTPGDGNGCRLIMRELGLAVPYGCQPFDKNNGFADMLPVRITSYINPNARMFVQEFMCADKMKDLLRVPCEKDGVNGKSDSIFYALGYTLPLCQIISNNWLMVTQCVDDNIKFHINNQLVGEGGLSWHHNNTSIILDIKYIDGNGAVINLGNDYEISNVNRNNNVFTWNKENNQLICACAGQPKTIKPFLDKCWADAPDVMPLSKKFIETLKEMNCSIKNYSYSDGEVSFDIFNDTNGTTLITISHTYPETDHIPFEMNQGNISVYRVMPRISVFPFCIIKNANDTLVWNKYYFTAIASCSDDFNYFERIKLKYKDGNVYNELTFKKKTLLKVSDNEPDVAYRATTTVIPTHIFVEEKENGQEIGVINVPEPETKYISSDNQAIVGVDMGSRNSIIAFYDRRGDPFHRYNYKGLTHNLIPSYVPYVDGEGKVDKKVKQEWEESLNLHGLNDENIDNSFTSAVLDYMDTQPGFRTDPMVHGRIIADLSEGSFKKIIRLAQKIEVLTHDKLAEVGYHSNFKRDLWSARGGGTNNSPHVELFVKNLCCRLLFIALYQGCGDIHLRFTAPNGSVGNTLKGTWQNALNYAKNELGLPEGGTDGIGQNIRIDNYMLESVALYYHIQNNASALPYRYSIIIDGGDSTFDVSMIKKENNDVSICKSFSIKYAGYDLLVKSIEEVIMKKAYDINDFIDMWIPDNTFNNESRNKRTEVKDLVSKILQGNGPIDCKSSKCIEDVIYKLIESDEGLCRNKKTKEVFALIKLKYFMLLNAIVKACVDNIPGDNSDQPVSVYLYGGSNSIAKMLFGNDISKISSSFSSIMTKWLENYENTSRTPKIVVNYRVNPNKLELVQGLVMTNNSNTNTDTENVVCADYEKTMYTQKTYEGIIAEMFPKDEYPDYWENGKFLLKTDVSERSELKGTTAEDIMTKVRDMISKQFDETLVVPDRAVYLLATMIYAVEQFKGTIKPDEE